MRSIPFRAVRLIPCPTILQPCSASADEDNVMGIHIPLGFDPQLQLEAEIPDERDLHAEIVAILAALEALAAELRTAGEPGAQRP
jgi:hypothetical protein